jgi:L-alanine-DL-glutamate epimerase-like enolase superfamily enzyme
MLKLTDISLREVTCQTEPLDFRTPIKFGGRVMSGFVVVNVTVVAETRDGRRGQGLGSMPMANVWAWPAPIVSPLPLGEGQGVRASRLASPSCNSPHPNPLPKGEGTIADKAQTAMIDLARHLADDANHYSGVGHPLEITHNLAQSYQSAADQITRAAGLVEPMPRLAQLVAASPLEAAVHDAYGKALGQNSYNLLGREFVDGDLAAYLTPEFAGEYLDQYTLRAPKPRMPLYHLVGALDPLTGADVVHPINDGLPETLPQWITFNGLTHLKIKLAGDDLPWDVNRVLSVERVAAQSQAARGCSVWHYSADFNEKCANVDYVLDFLAKVGERSPAALERLQYIEQPTHRNLRANPENRMHRAAKIKPVVIDESLVDLESLLLSRELGYSGVALKACKGHTGALLMAAAAQKYGMFLCVQDLTCPGASFLHSASLAARVPGVAAIEGNGRQYCPVGNRGWADRFPTMFRITDGTLGTAALDGPGLGF